jgi:isocitrate dehydrogenase kinase/phosphatase
MVGTDRPTPPADIAQYILDGLDRQDAESLREIAAHAEELADWKEAQAAAEMEEEDEVREDAEDLPDDVPAKAGVVTKTINENQYQYYQWREGDQVKSQYKGPVNSDE